MMLHSYHQILLICTLILYVGSISELNCYQCQSMIVNYTVTADNLPSPKNCSVVTTKGYCLTSVIWQLDGTSEIYYDSSIVDSLSEMVDVWIERRASEADQYSGERIVTYRCYASDTPCNSPKNLKRVISATTFPNDEQVNKLNTLIAVTPFNNTSCFIFSNTTTECYPVDLNNCQRCEVITDFPKSEICATCPKGSPRDINWFFRGTSYVLNNRTHLLDTVGLECQAQGQCNSLANVERIRQTTVNKFDFDQFFSSNAITPKLMLTTMIMALLTFVAFNYNI